MSRSCTQKTSQAFKIQTCQVFTVHNWQWDLQLVRTMERDNMVDIKAAHGLSSLLSTRSMLQTEETIAVWEMSQTTWPEPGPKTTSTRWTGRLLSAAIDTEQEPLASSKLAGKKVNVCWWSATAESMLIIIAAAVLTAMYAATGQSLSAQLPMVAITIIAAGPCPLTITAETASWIILLWSIQVDSTFRWARKEPDRFNTQVQEAVLEQWTLPWRWSWCTTSHRRLEITTTQGIMCMGAAYPDHLGGVEISINNNKNFKQETFKVSY